MSLHTLTEVEKICYFVIFGLDKCIRSKLGTNFVSLLLSQLQVSDTEPIIIQCTSKGGTQP